MCVDPKDGFMASVAGSVKIVAKDTAVVVKKVVTKGFEAGFAVIKKVAGHVIAKFASMIKKMVKYVGNQVLKNPTLKGLADRLQQCTSPVKDMQIFKCSGGDVHLATNRCANGGVS